MQVRVQVPWHQKMPSPYRPSIMSLKWPWRLVVAFICKNICLTFLIWNSARPSIIREDGSWAIRSIPCIWPRSWKTHLRRRRIPNNHPFCTEKSSSGPLPSTRKALSSIGVPWMDIRPSFMTIRPWTKWNICRRSPMCTNNNYKSKHLNRIHRLRRRPVALQLHPQQ